MKITKGGVLLPLIFILSITTIKCEIDEQPSADTIELFDKYIRDELHALENIPSELNFYASNELIQLFWSDWKTVQSSSSDIPEESPFVLAADAHFSGPPKLLKNLVIILMGFFNNPWFFFIYKAVSWRVFLAMFIILISPMPLYCLYMFVNKLRNGMLNEKIPKHANATWWIMHVILGFVTILGAIVPVVLMGLYITTYIGLRSRIASLTQNGFNILHELGHPNATLIPIAIQTFDYLSRVVVTPDSVLRCGKTSPASCQNAWNSLSKNYHFKPNSVPDLVTASATAGFYSIFHMLETVYDLYAYYSNKIVGLYNGFLALALAPFVLIILSTLCLIGMTIWVWKKWGKDLLPRLNILLACYSVICLLISGSLQFILSRLVTSYIIPQYLCENVKDQVLDIMYRGSIPHTSTILSDNSIFEVDSKLHSSIIISVASKFDKLLFSSVQKLFGFLKASVDSTCNTSLSSWALGTSILDAISWICLVLGLAFLICGLLIYHSLLKPNDDKSTKPASQPAAV